MKPVRSSLTRSVNTLSSASPASPVKASEPRKNGAFITLRAGDQTFTVWSTNQKFIHHAIELEREAHGGPPAGPGGRVPSFKVLKGGDADQWHFHFDPNEMQWVDQSIEIYDGRPSDIDVDVDGWISRVGRYAPWGSSVLSVDERDENGDSVKS